MKRHDLRWLFGIGVLAAALAVGLTIMSSPGRCGDLPAGVTGVLNDIQTAAERVLATEIDALDGLKKQLAALTLQQKVLGAERSAFRLQLSTQSNLLLRDEIEIEDLQRAMTDNASGVAALDARLGAIRQERDGVTQALERLDEQGVLNRNQLDLLLSDSRRDAASQGTIQTLRRVEKALAARRGLLEKIDGHLGDLLRQLEAEREAFVQLSGKLEAGLRLRETQMLYERRGNVVHQLGARQLQTELVRMRDTLRSLVNLRDWAAGAGDWQTRLFWLLVFIGLLAIWLMLLNRLRLALRRLEDRTAGGRQPVLPMAVKLVRRSLSWLGVLAYCAVFAHIQPLPLIVPLVPALLKMVWIQILYRWGIDFLRGVEKHLPAQETLLRRLRGLLRAMRFYAVAHVLIVAAIGPLSGLALALRLGFGGYLLIRGIGLGRSLPRPIAGFRQQPWPVLGWVAAMGFCWSFPAVGLLLELVGFGAMALHWQVSWARTLAVMLWGGLVFTLLRDLERGMPPASEKAATGEKRAPVRWLALRVGWLAWGALGLTGVAGAWGGRQAILDGLGGLLRFPIPVGDMRFSLLGILHGALILFVTHAGVRFWHILLQRRFLRHSGLDEGVQSSITAITSYLLWGVGLLIALRVFGLNATSLAFAFGALGVGLGFGLQAIFNNFVSGLILLFERPIQVGDSVEVGGVWGVVKKINVRSTLVQTYDNASLIIPNSEFISSQVTNWSFKDQRLRRAVSVGVAYGSDVALVRRTLLEIAGEVPEVLRQPAPDVLFDDFGDSALIFRLRFWTLLDSMIRAETEIRFAIARRFQTLGIEMPFPQREIRLRPAVAEGPRGDGLTRPANLIAIIWRRRRSIRCARGWSWRFYPRCVP